MGQTNLALNERKCTEGVEPLPNRSAGPEALLVGYPRCATTYVATELDRLGAVSLTDPKETHFLAREAIKARSGGPGDAAELSRSMVYSPDDWDVIISRARVRRPMRPVLEASVETAYEWHVAWPEIQRRCEDDVRIIVIVRDPVERALSAHRYLCNRGVETLSFDEALAVEAGRIKAGYQHIWHYEAESSYERTLPFVLEDAGSRVLLVDYADIDHRPGWSLRRIMKHLGVSAPVNLPVDQSRSNASGAPRSQLAQSTLNWVRDCRPALVAVKSVVPQRAREKIRRLNLVEGSTPNIDQYRRRFERTYEYLNRLRVTGAFGSVDD